MNLLAATGRGVQYGSAASAFALVATGVAVLPTLAFCGAGLLVGEALKFGE